MLQRFIILLLIVLFVTPTFVQVNAQENNACEKTSYSNIHHEFCLSVFLNENSEEKNEANTKAPVLTAELIDFSFLTTVLTHYHSHADWDISNLRIKQEQLFKLNCNFLI